MRKFFKSISFVITAIHLVLLISYLLFSVIENWMDGLANSGDLLESLFNLILGLLLVIPGLILCIPSAIYKDLYLEMGIGLYSFYLIILNCVIWLICEYVFYLNKKKKKEEIRKKEEERKKLEQLRKAKKEAKIRKQKIEEEKRSKEMEKRNKLFQSAMDIYHSTAIEINKTGSISLIKLLESNYAILTSDNLINLRLKGSWQDFQKFIHSIIDELTLLKENAIKYQNYDGSENTEYYEEKDSMAKLTEEKARTILGVSPNSSNEEIKRKYRKLAKQYHPDKASQTTSGIEKLAEKKFKEINEAYDLLAKI